MVKLELLSQNLVTIITKLSANQNIAKYLTNLGDNPLSKPMPTTPINLLRTKIFPYPFSPNAEIIEEMQIHVFYPRAKIEHRVVQNIRVVFEIVCHKNIWLFNDGSSSIRPYKLASEIIGTFDEKSTDTVGKLVFEDMNHIMLTDDFQAISITAQMMEFGSSQP